MENRNLEKALDIVSKLITGEELTERGDNSSLYQEYNNNAEIYDIVHMSLKKLNLSIYEYNNGLYVSAGENNRVFGYTNEELRKELGIKVNKDLYMAYFVMLIFLAVNRDERVIRIVLVTGISFILVSIFRYVVDAPRPYTLYEFKPVVKKEKTGQSMPSRHVFSAFVIGMSALYISVHLGILILADSFLMCFMRVIAGVHFPKDVIVGAIIGILSGVIGFYII